jgi:hypothetical protein
MFGSGNYMSQDNKKNTSLTLDAEVVDYIKKTRREDQSASARAEELLQRAIALETRERIEAEAKVLYDSLTDDQIAEESEWGRVGSATTTQLDQ